MRDNHIFSNVSVFRLILIIMLGAIVPKAFSQYFNYGQEPPNVKWKKIETPNFVVILPEGFEEQGIRVAGLLDTAYKYVGKSLNCKPKKLSVVLHTQMATPNAFVSWAPSRSEWFTSPQPTICSIDWLEILALHELRHMVQFSKIESEMPKIIRYLFGEKAALIITGAFLPFWYIEGDAVCNETSLSSSGSGRVPSFFKDTRARLVEKETFSFNKTYLGSYKDYIPDYYQMGYLMTGGARYLFNKIIWDSVVTNVAKKPYTLMPFNHGLKQCIGIGKRELFDTVYAHFRKDWMAFDDSLKTTSFKSISPSSRNYSNYLFGAKLSNGLYFAEKSCLSDINRFVLIAPNKEEKKIFTPGYHFNESLNAKDSLVVWCEKSPHVRWAFEDISLIRLLNLNTQKLKEFKHRCKFYVPVLSPDNTKIAAVEADGQYKFHIKIIDCKSGAIIWDYTSPYNDYFITPSWSNDGKSIIAVMLRQNQMGIGLINIESSEVKIVLPFANQEIKSPKEKGDWIYFVGGYTGIDNIFAVNKTTGNVIQQTSSRFGVWNPSFGEEELVYSEYAHMGYQLVSTNFDSLLQKEVHLEQLQISYPVAEKLKNQEGGIVNFKNAELGNYIPQKYSKIKNAINVHSWGPTVLDIENATVEPGLSLMSQNILSNTQMIVGYKYNMQNNEGIYFANLSYMGWFPIIQSNIEYGRKLSSYEEIVGTDTLSKVFDWRQADMELAIKLPFNFSKGKYFRKVQPSIGYYLMNRSDVSVDQAIQPNGTFHYFKSGLYASQILAKSHQDLLPNFAIIFDLNYTSSFSEAPDYDSDLSAENWLYLPGLKRNHGIKIYNGYQKKQQGTFIFDDKVRIARGYKSAINDKLYTFGVDYLFPIFCPDYGIGSFIYFKRLKAAVYYDQSFLSGIISDNSQVKSNDYSIKSSGIELTSDLHLFQLIAPLEIGVRANYLFNKGFNFEFMFGISYNFY